MPGTMRLLTTAMLLGAFAALAACGSDNCLVKDENCSDYYKSINNITYGCCGGLYCSPGPISGVPICQ